MSEEANTLNEDYLHYWKRSRSLSHSLIAVLPLLVLYQVGVVQAGYGQRLLVDVWIAGAFRSVRLGAVNLMNAVLVAGVIGALWRSERTGRFCPYVVLLIWAESAFFALALYQVSGPITSYLLGLPDRLFLSAALERYQPIVLGLGAGVYEEFVFRLLLVGGGAALLHKMFEWGKPLCFGVMVVVSSILFSLVHHVGGMEQFEFTVFLFRAVCGALLGVLYLTRGFGVAAWAHALYNAMVIWQMDH